MGHAPSNPNLGKFRTIAWVQPDGRLTREASLELDALMRRLDPGSLGYAHGHSVTQPASGSKGSDVAIDSLTGDITLHPAELLADTAIAFTVFNPKVAATDLVLISHNTGGTFSAYDAGASVTEPGFFSVWVRNQSSVPLSEAITLRFAVIKAGVGE